MEPSNNQESPRQEACENSGQDGDKNAPHPRLPQYTMDEVERSIRAIQLLIKVRDRCRKQGLINW